MARPIWKKLFTWLTEQFFGTSTPFINKLGTICFQYLHGSEIILVLLFFIVIIGLFMKICITTLIWPTQSFNKIFSAIHANCRWRIFSETVEKLFISTAWYSTIYFSYYIAIFLNWTCLDSNSAEENL